MIKDNPVFLNALSQGYSVGASTPLDLFWDELDDLQENYQQDRLLILAINAEKYNGSNENIPLDIEIFFSDIISETLASTIQDKGHIRLYHKEVMTMMQMQKQREANTDKKTERKRIEKYKSLLKHFDHPRIQSSSTWEQFYPLLEQEKEFQDIIDTHLKKSYFDKYIQYLKKKFAKGQQEKDDEEREEGEVDDDAVRSDGKRRSSTYRSRSKPRSRS